MGRNKAHWDCWNHTSHHVKDHTQCQASYYVYSGNFVQRTYTPIYLSSSSVSVKQRLQGDFLPHRVLFSFYLLHFVSLCRFIEESWQALFIPCVVSFYNICWVTYRSKNSGSILWINSSSMAVSDICTLKNFFSVYIFKDRPATILNDRFWERLNCELRAPIIIKDLSDHSCLMSVYVTPYRARL